MSFVVGIELTSLSVSSALNVFEGESWLPRLHDPGLMDRTVKPVISFYR